jgi:cellulose synthase/poly-beta-1,6-N-acetylglucosamine synthase-like glycosyltransferase
MKMGVRNRALYFIGILSYVVSLIPFFGVNAIRALLSIPVIAYALPMGCDLCGLINIIVLVVTSITSLFLPLLSRRLITIFSPL